MRKKLYSAAFALLAISLAPQAAIADEVWTTEEYDVTYEADRNRTAIWSYGDNGGTVFIDGLAGVYEGRESYSGYWVQDTSSLRCDTYREGADGEPTYYWGSFEIDFIDPDFPSRWKAQIGLCDQPAAISLTGTPMVGSAQPSSSVTPSNSASAPSASPSDNPSAEAPRALY